MIHGITIHRFKQFEEVTFQFNGMNMVLAGWNSTGKTTILQAIAAWSLAFQRWEQSATYYIDTHPGTEVFVKNSGLGFAIPYFHNGEPHDYVPDFIIRLNAEKDLTYQLIFETKGFDPLEEIKKAAAERWVKAVNADGNFGHWQYAIARKSEDVIARLDEALSNLSE